MKEYNHNEIENKWQEFWKENKIFNVKENKDKPKFYVLDMFPYPSGAGLHVGHPLGYIASDIYSRFMRLKGYNVLHPMGYDSFGLPAEQYAIETGQHPAKTTEENIARYREQLDKIGFSFDWDREVRTSSPDYYKHTQVIFLKLFNSWYNISKDRAEDISTLIKEFETNGNIKIKASNNCEINFSKQDWKNFTEDERQKILLNYRLTYIADTEVNWCPKLGTVLANDEVKEGLSERGGYPVEKKKMNQWMMRITAYADRLLKGLDNLEWSESLIASQKNWIGKSKGASIFFEIENYKEKIEVFTTRPDTIYGVSFMVLAPENELVKKITTKERLNDIENYIDKTKKKSERDRLSEVKNISGVFTGAYAINPISGEKIPIWIGDYVLAYYGTGAVMSVPCGDQRDYDFAKYFNLEIKKIQNVDLTECAYDKKDKTYINSDIINGKNYNEAVKIIINKLNEFKCGEEKIQYKLRDAVFSRQRYWGEPIPMYYKNGIPYPLEEKELPLLLPEVDRFLPTEKGEPPLGRAKDWKTKEGYQLEKNTMPGWAGSSWYFLRYMDNNNKNTLANKSNIDYWKDVDLYIGGAEHATGHLLYSRFWNMFLFDIGLVSKQEPFKKLINQGMILGTSAFVYRIDGTNKFVSKGLKKDYKTTKINVDISFVENDVLDIEKFKQWREEYINSEFILENEKYICGREVEKMSKSKYNVVNPDEIIEKYGADTLRLYEMFLGPIEHYKPWKTEGITGVYNFIKKLWKLYNNVIEEKANEKELKILHKTIKKIEEDIKNFSFNTSVSTFMIAVNELTHLKSNKKEILEPLLILISPYAPHIAEELWNKLGNKKTITDAEFPKYNEKYLIEDKHEYPVMFNGKMRFKMEFLLDEKEEVIKEVILNHEKTKSKLQGKEIKKFIVVKGKIINIAF